MDRRDVEAWFRENPPPSRVDVGQMLDRCEGAVKRHAREDAWLAAKNYALERAAVWQEEWSPPASEQFVTQEVCEELAWELQQHEPEPGDEEHLAGGPVKEALTPDSWDVIRHWVHDLAAKEEHQAWLEIVQFTGHRAKEIIRQERMTRDPGWDTGHRYSAIAAHVAEVLAHEYSLHAHPR